MRTGMLAGAAALAVAGPLTTSPVGAVGPTVVDRALAVRPAVAGGGALALSLPIGMAFLPDGSALVIEKASGKVKHVVNGVVERQALDLAVNFASERGLLGIAVAPDFAVSKRVFLFWTESSTGADSNVPAATALLGSRVDAFIWDGTALTHERKILGLRSQQTDAGQPPRGNHNGGVLRFGPDGKLYVVVGDVGRRGQMQNLPCGPTSACPGPAVQDDEFGGPEPDDAHLTGVVLRLNPDGTAPADNPFHGLGAEIGGEVGANLQKVYSYGVRNSFGMDFDPVSGELWMQENSEDAFDELNRVQAGQNGGWIQVMGPLSRVAEYRQIETTEFGRAFQQLRWGPANLAGTPAEAEARLYKLPGSHYSDPEFSWKYPVPPAGIGFVRGRALGPQYEGNLLLGSARPTLQGGHLLRMRLTGNRQKIAVDDPRLEDRVADNAFKNDPTESESLLFGSNFGTVTDVQTGPNGSIYVVSLTHGAVYEIYRRLP